MTYAENWSLICKLHKHLHGLEKEKNPEAVKDTRELWWPSKPLESKHEPILSNFSLNCNQMTMNPLSTPIKGSKFLEEGKSRWQSMSLI
jgi:hypothetical protein